MSVDPRELTDAARARELLHVRDAELQLVRAERAAMAEALDDARKTEAELRRRIETLERALDKARSAAEANAQKAKRG